MSNQPPALLCHYRYDPLDRLINHTLLDTPTLQRFYCKSRLATEIQGAMQHSIVQHGDQLLAQQRREGEVLDNTLLATDQQRSILSSLDKESPNQSIAYSPYGHRPQGSGLFSLLGFAGERPDPVTGHYLLGNGYRAFNPVLMRFNSPDNLSPFGQGGLNSYVYCSGDPVNFVDPGGHVKFFRTLRHFLSPIEKNIPPVNSLEGLDYDSFSNIAKFLDQSDMDSLAKTSRQLNEHSVLASESNLKSFINRHKRNADGVPGYTSYPEANSSHANPDGTISEIRYSIQGVGSSAFKKLDIGIEGTQSLGMHNEMVRRNLSHKLGAPSADVMGAAVYLRKLNVQHANVLLSALEENSSSIRGRPRQ
ncbi:RHS repeat-associated core domain-containing protein [Pseudomonas mandelii]|uniref:RHS repeat-associated core domain-containing protein n=1 Tax=Pseudomonas mandelii TaxID=75612 RepID=UPI00224B5D20|nr:RHS repeat-associated core domain-containing protein [Pseudomonas mandelii]MCX2901615.1 RHS repeat-associated core domain-containing protein [Pseudomonas mandelii]